MKETGIIMSGNHPKLILDGFKSQTRWVIKLKNYHRNVWDYCVPHNGKGAELLGEPYLKVPYDAITDNMGTRITCPYGQVGDRLWVRESFFLGGIKPNEWVCYKADTRQSDLEKFVWKPSLFMPHWASRITLEITEVRVERLQEMTPVDCVREGLEFDRSMATKIDRLTKVFPLSAIIPKFQLLWDSLNAERGYGWETNPWVWVISFRRISK